MSLKCGGCKRAFPKGRFGCMAICESKLRHVTPIHKTCKVMDELKCGTCSGKIIYTVNQDTINVPVLTPAQEKKACTIYKQVNSRATTHAKKADLAKAFKNKAIELNLVEFVYNTFYEPSVMRVRKGKEKEFAKLQKQYRQ